MANQVQKAEKEKVVKVREDKKRMTYQEKQEWASIEGDIEALENRIAAIEEEMQANGSDFGKLATLQKRTGWEKRRHSLKNTNAMSISVTLIARRMEKSVSWQDFSILFLFLGERYFARFRGDAR